MERIPKGDIITQQFIVKEPAELLDFLLEKQIRKSKNAIQSVLRRRLITVNGKLITQYNHPLLRGDKVAVMKVDQLKKVKKIQGVIIVYEDDYIIVIEKEYGLLSVPTEKEPLKSVQTILSTYVKKNSKNARLFMLHRLDREASGLMVFAKDMDTQGQFQRNWNVYVPTYDFTAVIEGAMPKDKGQIKSWLTENKNYQVFSSSFDNGGQEALTNYTVVKSSERYSLVRFGLVTRHRNQIRAQMQQLQRPIVGDRKYGATSSPIKRMAYHVGDMKIKHPASGRIMEFKSTVPKAMMTLVNK